jgi:hypothetical protein
VELDEEVFGVAAPAVGPWQGQLNELGGVKSRWPLSRQYGELRPGQALRSCRAQRPAV